MFPAVSVFLTEGDTQQMWGELTNPENGAFCICEVHTMDNKA